MYFTHTVHLSLHEPFSIAVCGSHIRAHPDLCDVPPNLRSLLSVQEPCGLSLYGDVQVADESWSLRAGGLSRAGSGDWAPGPPSVGVGTKYVAGTGKTDCACFAPHLPQNRHQEGTKGWQGEVPAITQCEQKGTDRPRSGLMPRSTPQPSALSPLGLGLPNCTIGQPSTPATVPLSAAPSPGNTGQMRPRGNHSLYGLPRSMSSQAQVLLAPPSRTSTRRENSMLIQCAKL